MPSEEITGKKHKLSKTTFLKPENALISENVIGENYIFYDW